MMAKPTILQACCEAEGKRASVRSHLPRRSARVSRLRLAALVAAVSTSTLSLIPIVASAIPMRGVPINQPNAPVAILRCTALNGGWVNKNVNILNRSKHALLALIIQHRYYDADGILIGQTSETWSPDTAVASGDQGVVQYYAASQLSEPDSAIARVTCQVTSASFSGLKKWTSAQKWSEPVLPLPRSTDDSMAP
jgi:hypothetical protein